MTHERTSKRGTSGTSAHLSRTSLTALIGAFVLLTGLLVPPLHTPAVADGCDPVEPDPAADPVEIDEPAHLLWLGEGARTSTQLGRDYLQTDDIDLTGCDWTPIGSFDDPFGGTYDGGHHTITALKVPAPNGDSFVGMFGVLNGTVRNVILEDVAISGGGFVGALVGYSNGGTVENSGASGTVSGGTISGSGNSVGGLVGYHYAGNIRNSYAAVDVLGAGVGIGALVGYLDGSDDTENLNTFIVNSYASGPVSGNDDVGGLVGIFEGGAAIVDSYATGSANATAAEFSVGGLIGNDNGAAVAEVAGSFWDTDVTWGGTSASEDGTDAGSETSTDAMKSFGTFDAADWPIVNGWDEFDPDAAKVWGICPGVNDGYPFLLWQFEASPCGGAETVDPPTSTTTITDEGGDGSEDVPFRFTVAFDCANLLPGAEPIFANLVDNPEDGKYYQVVLELTYDADKVCEGQGNWTAPAATDANDDGTRKQRTFTYAPVQYVASEGCLQRRWTAAAGVNGADQASWRLPTTAVCGPPPPPPPAEDADPVEEADPAEEAAPAEEPAPAVTPVLNAGAAPSVPAGSGVWQRADGTQVPLEVSSPEEGQVRYAADGLQVTITGAAGTSATNGLVADPDGEVECEVCTTLAPGGIVEAWVFSTPRLAGAHTVVAGDCQTFTISMADPADGEGPVVAGAHTLQLALPSADGMQAVNVGMTVGSPVPTSVPAGDGPAAPVGLLAFGLLAAAGAALAARRMATAG